MPDESQQWNHLPGDLTISNRILCRGVHFWMRMQSANKFAIQYDSWILSYFEIREHLYWVLKNTQLRYHPDSRWNREQYVLTEKNGNVRIHDFGFISQIRHSYNCKMRDCDEPDVAGFALDSSSSTGRRRHRCLHQFWLSSEATKHHGITWNPRNSKSVLIQNLAFPSSIKRRPPAYREHSETNGLSRWEHSNANKTTQYRCIWMIQNH